MPTETTLNSLNVHKVPDFETWEENYNQVDGIGTSDVVVIPPEELKKGILPSQLGNSGKFLTTNGTTTSWTNETDPTVPSWAKAASKPTYTASEVGAQEEITVSGVLQGDGNGGITAKTVDSTPTNGSSNLVSSDGVYDMVMARTKIYTASCTTPASTAAKVATLDDATDFSLTAGVMVVVRFTYGNSAATPTLNVQITEAQSTGAKSIAIPSTSSTYATSFGTSYNTWGARETILFTYTGTYWTHLPSGLLGYLAYNLANGRQTKITASGLLKGDGSGGVSAAVAGTDYATPSALSAYIPTAQKGAASGVASLDSYGKVTASQLSSRIIYQIFGAPGDSITIDETYANCCIVVQVAFIMGGICYIDIPSDLPLGMEFEIILLLGDPDQSLSLSIGRADEGVYINSSSRPWYITAHTGSAVLKMYEKEVATEGSPYDYEAYWIIKGDVSQI